MPIFHISQFVALKSSPNKHFPVIEILQTPHTETRYKVFVDNTIVTYYQSQLTSITNTPSTRNKLTANALKARITALQLQTPSASRIYSLNSGRIQFVPYQYRPVLKLIRADRPRLLIADEVGVGKTIEAGLILKELKARMEINSVLIICPKALVAEQKWHNEMKRFDEEFEALDGAKLRHCLKETDLEGQWPRKNSYAILPFSLFDSELVEGNEGKCAYKGLLTLDPPLKFDLIIVDEAHHLRNSETWLHRGVSLLCEHAQAVIFLSATPIQLGEGDLYTLLNLLRPDLIIDKASFKAMAEPNPHLNTAITHCRKKSDNWQNQALDALQTAANTDWGQHFLQHDPDFQATQTELSNTNITEVQRVKLIRNIESFYTFNSLINRTRRRDIGNFTQRRPQTIEVDFTAPQRHLHECLLNIMADIYAYNHGERNVKFMLSTIRRQAASCLHGLAPLLKDMLERKLNNLQIIELADDEDELSLDIPENIKQDIQKVIALAECLPTDDLKVERLLALIKDKQQQANNKILLFSSFRHTLRYLVNNLPQDGTRFGLIHGEINHEDRADLRRRFALPREDQHAIDCLLSSEVGCEGLDFQFCDYLINYDLPWNPMRIEQRIGRIDRYGQRNETVAIVNFITPDTVDADIYHRCLWRIGVFESAIGGCEAILGEITQQIHSISEQFELTEAERQERLQQLADNDIRILHEQEALENSEAELFGIDISKQAWNDTLAEATSPFLTAEAMQRLVSHYLQHRLAKEHDVILGDKATKTLRLNQEDRQQLLADNVKLNTHSKETVARAWEHWLKSNEPNLAISFTQEGAAEHSKVQLIDTLHPLTRLAMQAVLIEAQAYSSLTANSTNIAAGLYPFAIYRWDSKGVKADQEFIAVTENPDLRAQLMSLLAEAETGSSDLPEQSVFDDLEQHHYRLWQHAQAEHQAKNRQRVEHRLQSLRSSHTARIALLRDIIQRNTNPLIQTMKQAELHNAEADYQHRVTQLENDRDSGDIHAQAVLFGIVEIRN